MILCFQILEALNNSPSHKEIIVLVSSHNEKFLNAVNDHFHRTTFPQSATSLAEVLSSIPQPGRHPCRPKSFKPADDVPPAKKAKTDSPSDANACVLRLLSETETLKSILKQTRLSAELKHQLSYVKDELNSICEDSLSEL